LRLAAIYSVWNGLEHFEGSLAQIYDEVDVVIIGWQKRSHYNEFSPTVKPFVQRMKDKYPKVVLVEFVPIGGNPKKEQRRKINQLLKVALKHRCTHFFMSATDHYYDKKQFRRGKEIAKNYQVTASKMWTYFKKPIWRLKNPETYYMPFICELNRNTCVKKGGWNVRVDPALCFHPNKRFYEFRQDELMMHHYSFVRIDIENKLRNAAARGNFKNKIPELLKKTKNFTGVGRCPYFNQEVDTVKNRFNIDL
jgi:hypothetical protein